MADRIDLARLMALRPGEDPPDLLAALLVRPWWHQHAECRGLGVDRFFPKRGESTAPAKALCQRCPVRDECLDYALEPDNAPEGVWGNTSPRERQRLRNHRHAA